MLSTIITALISLLIIEQQVISKQQQQQQPASSSISIRMPDIRPDYADQYLCITRRVSDSPKGHYIVGINPQGDSSRVHHMLLYGCRRPGIFQRDSPNFVWECGSMFTSTDEQTSFERGSICQGGGEQILYGWAMDAPSLQLPDSVGFKIGSDTGIEFLVLQVHYGHHEQFDKLPDLSDNAGLILDTVPNEPESGTTRRAGVLLLGSFGYVEEGKSRHEIWCTIDDNIVLHPFKFRVHTHKMGTRVLGAKIAGKNFNPAGSKYEAKDLTIGIRDPQLPQMFYPVREQNMTISKGDTVYAHCEFNNPLKRRVEIGHTGNDEMCNFYLMYWTDSPRLLTKNTCSQQNPYIMTSNMYDI